MGNCNCQPEAVVQDGLDENLGEDQEHSARSVADGISCPQTFTTMEFPMYVMSMADFMDLKRMRPQVELLAEGKIRQWEPSCGPVNLLSHQWLGFSHPDPEAEQLKCMQEVFKNLMAGKTPFRSEKDWDLYSKVQNYAKLQEQVGKRRRASVQRKSVQDSLAAESAETKYDMSSFVKTITDGCIWLDYAGVPQVGVREAAADLDEKFHSDQQKAVNSIPAYVEAAENLWVMSPPCAHADLNTECNYATWKTRGWCRVEDWANEFSIAARRPLIVEGPMDVWVEDLTEKLTATAQRQHSALNGNFTCCRLGHTVDGKTFPCDKPRVREVICGALDGKINYLWHQQDFVYYAWFMSLKPMLLAETGEDGALDIPKDESLAAFLKRYGWRGDVEGKDTPEQQVFFPLFSAATEGNLPAVKWLLDAKADVNRRLLGVGTSPLEAACVSGHVECCEWLLAQGADLHCVSVLNGHGPVHKAASGGSPKTLAWVLEKRADVEMKTSDGSTPLHCAAQNYCVSCAKVLLEAHGDLGATDASGHTALQVAVSKKCEALVSLLQSGKDQTQ